MPLLTDPYDFETGATADAEQVDARFEKLYTAVNGALDEENMAVPKGVFRAHRATALVIPTSPGLITFDSESFDTSGWYDESNGRFTPQVAGYYRLSWVVGLSVASATQIVAALFKNAGAHAFGQVMTGSGGTFAQNSVGSAVVEANGSTDFFDVRVHWLAGAPAVEALAYATFFCGELIGRSA